MILFLKISSYFALKNSKQIAEIRKVGVNFPYQGSDCYHPAQEISSLVKVGDLLVGINSIPTFNKRIAHIKKLLTGSLREASIDLLFLRYLSAEESEEVFNSVPVPGAKKDLSCSYCKAMDHTKKQCPFVVHDHHNHQNRKRKSRNEVELSNSGTFSIYLLYTF